MTTQYIEFQNVLNNFGGDTDLLKDTVALSLKYLPQHLEKVRHAVVAKDAKELEISAHTIKGSLSLYLYKPIVQSAFELEKLGRTNSLESASTLLATFENQLDSIMSELKHYSQNN
jgi:HPt (histidine-containing phosphotransfer) domain-containing protein